MPKDRWPRRPALVAEVRPIEPRDHHARVAQALGDVLAGFKNPERVKRDLLSDGIDPLNREVVEKWLGENGDDYAYLYNGEPQSWNSIRNRVWSGR